jgi:homocysteine S-methyltransferase
MRTLLDTHELVLMEAAVIESLRRASRVALHPVLANAPLIYDERGRDELSRLYLSYASIAIGAHLPLLLCAPTWRANRERLRDSRVSLNTNRDAVRFMRGIRDSQGAAAETIKIGGLIGCKNDCYRPAEALSTGEAEHFHSWQVDQLAGEGVDFLIAATLPSVEEATGIARAMGRTATPYVISFVIDPSGRVLDGADLWEAVKSIDAEAARRPLGYMVNCSYPTFLCAESQPPGLFDRLIGYQANASSLKQGDLDGAAQLRTEAVDAWGKEMLRLNAEYGVKILGGCCGTSAVHLEYLAAASRR